MVFAMFCVFVTMCRISLPDRSGSDERYVEIKTMHDIYSVRGELIARFLHFNRICAGAVWLVRRVGN